MLGQSQLNIYIVGASLGQRQRERLQAQVESALRSLPRWPFDLLRRRLEQLGASHFPLIVEPQAGDSAGDRALGLGQLDGRPAVRLMPVLAGDTIDWRQDRRYLVAKAVAYLAAPPASDAGFWTRWSRAVAADGLREHAREADEHWAAASDLELFVEMAAACALNPDHHRWPAVPSVRAFLDEWHA